jgi:hypothetical protein
MRQEVEGSRAGVGAARMIDWGLATRRQMIGGDARSRRGRLSEKSMFLLPPVETRAVAVAV